jgi:GTP-binding protein
MHPIIAIVGRSNVGKSRLFNRIIGRGKAIVADMPGVTRDRLYAEGDWCGRSFIAVDTGGLDLDPAASLARHVTKQSLRAIDEADVIVCVFDGQVEPASEDREIVSILRKASKPVVYAVNKIDEDAHDARLNDFLEFGFERMFPVSAEHGRGIDDLLDEIARHFPSEDSKVERNDELLTVSVIGRPNVGKSTLVNRLAGEERVVAHEEAGTTRDAIDVEIEYEGKKYLFIDTAGIKKRWGVADPLEKYTAIRALRTVDRAKIVIQLIDAKEGLTRQDISLTGFIREEGKGCLMLANKWDLMDKNWKGYEADLRDALGDLALIPIIPISATNGTNCLKVFAGIDALSSALGKKIATSRLNGIMEEAQESHHMPTYKGKEVRIYYATQTGVYPPTFALFSNHPEAVPYAYRKYLMRKIAHAMGDEGIPIKLICKRK